MKGVCWAVPWCLEEQASRHEFGWLEHREHNTGAWSDDARRVFGTKLQKVSDAVLRQADLSCWLCDYGRIRSRIREYSNYKLQKIMGSGIIERGMEIR